MEKRDIYWIKKEIEKGNISFKDGVEASDSVDIFRYDDEHIVQADEFLYMDRSLKITKIDERNVIKELNDVSKELMNIDRLYINMDRYLSLDATIYLDCLFFDGRTNEIECNDFVIDSEHYFIKNEEI